MIILKEKLRKEQRYVAWWLLLSALMIVLMVTVGGLTRLTESGLSMTDWKPVTGIFPPVGEEAWQEEFARYQQSPEFQKVNHHMSLEDFQGIFWLEYIHRVLGRLTGFVFILPLVAFAFKGWLEAGLKRRLWLIFVLGGLQGLLGWYMVKSGLVDDPRVSPYRLTMHLGMAFIIFTLIWWEFLQFTNVTKAVKKRYKEAATLKKLSWVLWGALFTQILLGGLVAGNDAGLIYNTYPKMGEHWVPAELFSRSPWFINFFENPTLVQFMHRTAALMVVILYILFFLWLKNCAILREIKAELRVFLVLLTIQFSLGVLTLLHQVPVGLASTHQVVALLLLGTMTAICVRARTLYLKV